MDNNLKCEKRGQGEVCIKFQRTKKIGYDSYNKRPVYVKATIKEYKNIPHKSVDGKTIKNYSTLSISGHSKNFAGQIYDTITDDSQVKLSVPKEKVKKLVNVWKRWHLNDLKAGTKRQEEALSKIGGANANKYDEQVSYLKKKGIYSDKGYKFGTAWLVEPLPKDVEKDVQSFFSD